MSQPKGEISIFTFKFQLFQGLTSQALMSNFDGLYLCYISRHAFHFLTFFVFKMFCFGNIWSNAHVQYPFVS